LRTTTANSRMNCGRIRMRSTRRRSPYRARTRCGTLKEEGKTLSVLPAWEWLD
jgi:hypothetical protein